MPKNTEKPQLSLITSEERTADGNLLPDVRERVVKSVQAYLRQVGYLNISEISQQLGLSRQTTKRLTDEILTKWRMEMENQFLVQIQWYLAMIKDMDENPGTFTQDKRALARLKSAFLTKTNVLLKIFIK